MSAVLRRLKNVSKTNRGLTLLRSITVNVVCGRVLGVWGPNGVGKSTLARIIAGTLEPDDPMSMVTEEVDVNVGYVPQDPSIALLSWENVLDNFLSFLPRRDKLEATRWLRGFGFDESDLKRYPYEFSGGFRQRLACASALFRDRRLIVLDEPFSGLDGRSAAHLVAVIRYAASEGRAVVVVAHDPSIMAVSADDVACICSSGAVEMRAIQLPEELRTLNSLGEPAVENISAGLATVMWGGEASAKIA